MIIIIITKVQIMFSLIIFNLILYVFPLNLFLYFEKERKKDVKIDRPTVSVLQPLLFVIMSVICVFAITNSREDL